MEVKPVLDLPEGLKIIHIEMRDQVLNITVISTQMHPCCPVCGTPAQRIHSSYHRQISDLPCSEQPVRFLVQVLPWDTVDNSASPCEGISGWFSPDLTGRILHLQADSLLPSFQPHQITYCSFRAA
jgi:zinc-finger of transposase IS204/IS1001/IS1096/IS1165